jgi:hypothetical protein
MGIEFVAKRKRRLNFQTFGLEARLTPCRAACTLVNRIFKI